MTRTSDFDGILSDWLDDEDAARSVPDYARRDPAAARARPASARVVEPRKVAPHANDAPYRARAQARAGRAHRSRLLAVAGIAVLTAGSRRIQLAPPTGLARNGPIVYDKLGDIYRYDPATGMETALVTGAENDTAPLFSRDGSRILFSRGPDGGARPPCWSPTPTAAMPMKSSGR